MDTMNDHEKTKDEQKNTSSSSYASFLAWMYSPPPALKENHTTSCTTQQNKKEESNGIPHFSIRISDLDRRRLRHVEPKKRTKIHHELHGTTCRMPNHPVLRELLARFEQKEKRKIICHSIENYFHSF